MYFVAAIVVDCQIDCEKNNIEQTLQLFTITTTWMCMDEVHVLLYCNLYANVRQTLFDKAVSINSAFPTLNDNDKLSFILSNVSIANLVPKPAMIF